MPLLSVRDNVEIYYEKVGTGFPLLLISGTGHDHRFWSGQLEALSAKYTCIVADNRGIGKSSIPEPGYTLADMAHDLTEIMDHLGFAEFHLMGFSMGGHMAQEIAINHPERVRKLGLHHTWSRCDAHLRDFQSIRLRLAQQDDLRTLFDLSFFSLYSPAYHQQNEAALERKKSEMMQQVGSLQGWAGQLQACITGDTYERLSLIQSPTLVTCSEMDFIVPVHLSKEIAERIEGSELKVLKGTGHVALIEQPDIFAKLCIDFLAD